jgi:histidine triad (HIT) family protein
MPESERARVAYEDRVCRVMVSRYRVERGHMLVVSKAHYDSFLDVPDPLIGKMFKVAKRFGKVASRRFGCRGMDIGVNVGIASSIHHFHIHIMPRYSTRMIHFATGKDEVQQKEAEEIIHLLKL